MFLLYDATDKIWGVFSDRERLFASYMLMKEAAGRIHLSVREYKPNTNLVLNEWTDEADIMKEFSFLPVKKQKEDTIAQDAYPKAMKSQLNKLFDRYRTFVENFDVFKKLECKRCEDAPVLLRPYFEVFSDLVRLQVPDVEAFGYFMDRITPQTEELSL